MSGVTIQEISYGGWDRCIQISNNVVELVVTVDVGPRIIRYGFAGQHNELGEIQGDMGNAGGSEWRMYGGHRLWISPESKELTYEADNVPVPWENINNGIITSQKKGAITGVAKEMEIVLSPDDTEVTINHRLINCGDALIEVSAWAITIMAAGGTEVIPQSIRDTGLLPNRSMTLWPYTRLDDHRIRMGNRFILLKQDSAIERPLKLGTTNHNGWAAYLNNYHLFVKKYDHVHNAVYPDMGVSYETYTNDFMLEMESLSPLSMIEPGNSIDHRERWELFDNIPGPFDNEESIEKILSGKVPRQI